MATKEFWIQLENRPWDACPNNISHMDRLTEQLTLVSFASDSCCDSLQEAVVGLCYELSIMQGYDWLQAAGGSSIGGTLAGGSSAGGSSFGGSPAGVSKFSVSGGV